MSPNQIEKVLMFPLFPIGRYQQLDVAGLHVYRSMQNPSFVAAADRHQNLLTDSPIAGIQGRRFGEDRFVEHQQNRPHAVFQAVFEPPFDCRQVGERWAKQWRGRFQRMPSLRKARLMLLREVSMAWTSSR